MKKAFLFILCITIIEISHSQELIKVDPNHTDNGGYGYLINSDETCSLWWSEGVYKVMKDAPVPSRSNGNIKIWSARNEYESVIIVLNPKKRMENFRISVSDLTSGMGSKITNDNIIIKKVEYVRVTKPTDSYSFPGWWPDPVPVYGRPESIYPAENQPFWITFRIPENAQSGDYRGIVELSSNGWKQSVPVNLHVWNFTLPDKPSLRSGFGFNFNSVAEYDNIKTPLELSSAFNSYMKSFRDYKISPYNPFELSPVKETIKGIAWKGGFFDNKEKYKGNYSYRVEDKSATSNSEAVTRELIPVKTEDNYSISWFAKSMIDSINYVVGVECYNMGREFLTYENRFEVYTGKKNWTTDTLKLEAFDPEIKFIKIRLFPALRTSSGEEKGTVWFDDIILLNEKTKQNEFTPGDFEVNLDEIDISMDFTDFNQAGKLYLDEYGFNSFRLSLKGLGKGNFYSQSKGYFEGFEQGTDEYYKLMERYLKQIQDNLEKSGWLGKEYIYWFDEPGEKEYAFVKETNALIKKYAPKLTTFITEHIEGQDISDVTDISCTIWHKLDHNKILKMNEKGQECWSYLCCWPKSPWISEFIDHDVINLRMWTWASYKHNLKGILIWQTTYWNSDAASPIGYLQDPRNEAMSFVHGFGWPLGKQTIWGNGDGRFFYPLNRDPNNDSHTYLGLPIPSLRLEILRDGIEDYEYLKILEKGISELHKKNKNITLECKKLLEFPDSLYENEFTYSKNPQDILNYRKRIAEYIESINKILKK